MRKPAEKRDIHNVKASDIINVSCVSEILTGNPEYIRKSWIDRPSKIPKKYRRTVLNLVQYVEAFLIDVEDLKRFKK